MDFFMRRILTILLILGASMPLLAASELDELDKPPEGAHEGQILIGGFVTIGGALGQLPKAEDAFVDNSYYLFTENNQAKALWLSHLAFSFGITGEYMFLDRLGARARIKRTYILQRTLFGSDYENWSYSVYRDFSFYIGPALHLTTRRQWDVSLTPLVGFYVGVFQSTPVAKKILKDYVSDPDVDYAGEGKKSVSGFTTGAELAFTAYFSGGLFISLGADWTMSMVRFDKKFSLTNPQTSKSYTLGTNPSIHTLGIIITAGYAFYN